MANGLPRFLEPLAREIPCKPHTTSSYSDAVFKHQKTGLLSHVLWWPACTESYTDTLLLFIPGNPGLVDFYTPFLTAIHDKTNGHIPILARAHLAHTPHVHAKDNHGDPAKYNLTAQIDSVIELLDVIQMTYRKVVIVAHSVGTWITMQVLKARPAGIESVFLLFPTISHISDTPNGRMLSWLFKPPLPSLISSASLMTRLLPARLLSTFFPNWPAAQFQVLQSLIRSPACVYACLTMAHDEMTTIKDLDLAQLHEYHERIYLFYGEKDDWVGSQRELVRRALGDETHVTIVHDFDNIPHSFCINHHKELAEQCVEWLAARDIA